MPFCGVNAMTAYLIRRGYNVNVKMIRRLMRIIGLEAIYPGRRLSVITKEHLEYPIFLKILI
jgi:putative transposase